ncbi:MULTISPECIES: A/G-specific adenine glycosylase [unclassified Frondihabitans]|uniref:A/G-specific adenine glycosylase n=1 Tax=unclassified Frondihabitans TaxID=2626248 RepID=UPI000FA17802|nr:MULTISPECIES: A/G-specific adenine glycosylase [unclassified Frondihabitans]RPE74571.1 A/G-specific DNA-adenine glycosylase [Frondihabitans sp. PhB153]RPF03000.1 A/G-specific DNA-adenine glycosylase [Frondihabitans sp. PhB161]
MTISPAIVAWFRENGRDLPWRRPGFSPWGTLVSEFMLQQTPVVRVIPKLEAWLERWPTPAALASSPASEAVRAWDRLGYPRRALNLHACAVAITDQHGGEVPSDVDALLALPGIGDYTARAIATFAFGLRVPVVDTNVRRVLTRAVEGRAEPASPNAKHDLPLMESQLPDDLALAHDTNAGVMELGALVCVARNPRCDDCPLRDQCAWVLAGKPAHEGPARRTQKKYEGSDRQVRGRILGELRASDIPVTAAEVDAVWPDAAQRARALASLLRDGLVTGSAAAGYTLPE